MKWDRIDAAVAKAIEGLGYQSSKRDQDELRAALEDVKEQVADEKEECTGAEAIARIKRHHDRTLELIRQLASSIEKASRREQGE